MDCPAQLFSRFFFEYVAGTAVPALANDFESHPLLKQRA
jgi:hypothetical protein